MADSTLKINVQTTADTSGIDQVKTKIDDLKQSTEQASEVTSGLGEAIGLAVGATAVAAITTTWRVLQDLTAQDVKLNEELIKGETALARTEQHWLTMAENARTFIDAARVGSSAVDQVTQAHQRLVDAQNKLKEGVGFLATLGEFLAKMGNWGTNVDIFTQKLRDQVDMFKRLDDQARFAAVAVQQFAEAEAKAYDAAKLLPYEEGLAKVRKERTDLQEKLIGIDPLASDEAYQRWVNINTQIANRNKTEDELTRGLQRQKDVIRETQDQIARNLATGDDELSIQTQVNQTYDQRLKLLLAAKVPYDEAVRQATELRESERQRLETIRGQAPAQREYNQTLHDSQMLLQAIRQQEELIKGEPFMGVDAKQTALLALQRAQMAAIGVEILRLQADIKGGGLDPAVLERDRGEVQRLTFEYQRLGQQVATASRPIQAELASWVNSFGSTSHQIATTIEGTINTSLQGTNQLLLDAVFRTGNWQQTLQGVERQVLNTFATMLEQMLLQQAASLLGITTTTTAQTASGAAIAAAHAPAAAATSISSYGVAAIVGEAAALAAIFAIMAALAHEGGPMRRRKMHIGGLASDEIPIIAQEGEFMIQRSVAQRPGMGDFLMGLNEGMFHGGGAIRRMHDGGWTPQQQGIIDRINSGQTDFTFGPGSPGATREDRQTFVGGKYSPAGGFAVEGGVALSPSEYYLFTPAQRRALGIMDIAPRGQAGKIERYYGSRTHPARGVATKQPSRGGGGPGYFPMEYFTSPDAYNPSGDLWTTGPTGRSGPAQYVPPGWVTVGGVTDFQPGVYIGTAPGMEWVDYSGITYEPSYYNPGQYVITSGPNAGNYVSSLPSGAIAGGGGRAPTTAGSAGGVPPPGGFGGVFGPTGRGGGFPWQDYFGRMSTLALMRGGDPSLGFGSGSAISQFAKSFGRQRVGKAVMLPFSQWGGTGFGGPTGGKFGMVNPDFPMRSERHSGGAIGRMHSGGSAKAGGFGAPQVHVYAFTDLKALTRHMGSREGQKIIFDTVQGRRIDLGLH